MPNSAPLEVLLAQVELFRDIRDQREALGALAGLMREVEFKAGATIIREGDQGNDFFVLAEGTASVFKKTPGGDTYKVARLQGHAGTFFGEGALLEADTRTATIQAETDCRCLTLSALEFETFAQAHPQWAMPIFKRVAQAIMHRLRNMNRDLSLLYKALVDEFAQSA